MDVAERRRRVDLKRVVEQRFGVVTAARAIGDLLPARGFRPLSRTATRRSKRILKKLAARVAQVIPDAAGGGPIEIWFQDEARVRRKGTLAYVWARRGTRPRAVRDTRYVSAYLFGSLHRESVGRLDVATGRLACAASLMPANALNNPV